MGGWVDGVDGDFTWDKYTRKEEQRGITISLDDVNYPTLTTLSFGV